MEIDGGGWLAFQYRHNGEVDFQRNWQAYKEGFGSMEKEFWLGNDLLHYFTTHYDQELYIKGERFNGNIGVSRYSEFKIDNEADKYRLHLSGPSGQASFGNNANGLLFSAPGEDNDSLSNRECSTEGAGRGGFWFSACGKITPNAFYYNQTETVPSDEGILWKKWIDTEVMKGTEWMIRRKD